MAKYDYASKCYDKVHLIHKSLVSVQESGIDRKKMESTATPLEKAENKVTKATKEVTVKPQHLVRMTILWC